MGNTLEFGIFAFRSCKRECEIPVPVCISILSLSPPKNHFFLMHTSVLLKLEEVTQQAGLSGPSTFPLYKGGGVGSSSTNSSSTPDPLSSKTAPSRRPSSSEVFWPPDLPGHLRIRLPTSPGIFSSKRFLQWKRVTPHFLQNLGACIPFSFCGVISLYLGEGVVFYLLCDHKHLSFST